jgi:hypothetical protein
LEAARGLLGGVEAAVDQFLQQRMIQRDLLDRAGAHAVQARVAHMGDGDPVVEEQRRDHRGAHAFALGWLRAVW